MDRSQVRLAAIHDENPDATTHGHTRFHSSGSRGSGSGALSLALLYFERAPDGHVSTARDPSCNGPPKHTMARGQWPAAFQAERRGCRREAGNSSWGVG